MRQVAQVVKILRVESSNLKQPVGDDENMLCLSDLWQVSVPHYASGSLTRGQGESKIGTNALISLLGWMFARRLPARNITDETLDPS